MQKFNVLLRLKNYSSVYENANNFQQTLHTDSKNW